MRKLLTTLVLISVANIAFSQEELTKNESSKKELIKTSTTIEPLRATKVLVTNISSLMLGAPESGELRQEFNLPELNKLLEQGYKIKHYQIIQQPDNTSELSFSIIWFLFK